MKLMPEHLLEHLKQDFADMPKDWTDPTASGHAEAGSGTDSLC
jgi:hypothetical protein